MRDALRFGPFQHDGAWRTGASAALTAALPAAVGILMLNDGRSHAEAVMAGGFAAVLVMLAAYDLADRIVPNRIVLPALALARPQTGGGDPASNTPKEALRAGVWMPRVASGWACQLVRIAAAAHGHDSATDDSRLSPSGGGNHGGPLERLHRG